MHRQTDPGQDHHRAEVQAIEHEEAKDAVRRKGELAQAHELDDVVAAVFGDSKLDPSPTQGESDRKCEQAPPCEAHMRRPTLAAPALDELLGDDLVPQVTDELEEVSSEALGSKKQPPTGGEVAPGWRALNPRRVSVDDRERRKNGSGGVGGERSIESSQPA